MYDGSCNSRYHLGLDPDLGWPAFLGVFIYSTKKIFLGFDKEDCDFGLSDSIMSGCDSALFSFIYELCSFHRNFRNEPWKSGALPNLSSKILKLLALFLVREPDYREIDLQLDNLRLIRHESQTGPNFRSCLRISMPPLVEVPGIEPGSSSTDTELLRA